MLISINKCNVNINGKEFTSFNQLDIEKAINSLHINATINKEENLTLEDTYYITFKYANEKQKEEITYFFNCKINYNKNNEVYPITIDKNKCLTDKNNGTIIATNIPQANLKEIIKNFIEIYDIIINIDNEQLKDFFMKKNLMN